MLPTKPMPLTPADSPSPNKLPWSQDSFVPIPNRRPWRNGLLGVAKYEWERSLTWSRLLGLLLIIAFPVALIATVKTIADVNSRATPDTKFVIFSIVVFVLIPQIATMLSLLLWATPAVNSELEGQTWIYALVRPNGRIILVLGKYLVAVFWSLIGGTVSVSLLVPILQLDRSWDLWWTTMRLLFLASVAYSALYIMIGTFFQRRSMVVAFIYTVVIEGLLSFLPATVNQLTVSYRLRSLFLQWINIKLPADDDNPFMIADLSGEWHLVLGILIYAVVCLTISAYWLRRSEYSLQPEAAL
jgi:ABC-type transport system involved in multi-copper enzyme maturation permease subunit